MPWKIKKSGDQYCVYKKGGGKVKGGCHPTKQEALKHMRALYSNVSDAQAEASLGERILDKIFAGRTSDVTAQDVSLVTIKDVPILSTGIEYPLASGPTTFTEEDLIDAVKAEKDPHVLAPRLKIGHPDAAAWVEAGGMPAFGKVSNLHLGDNNQTIYGDYTGVPEWLANILPTAYPNRSIEGNWNIETVGGNKYRLVINAVALLGVEMPGVTSLEDLKDAYGAEKPEAVEVAAERSIVAAVNLEDIQRSYYDALKAQGSEYDFWWIRAVQLNPNELIVDTGEGLVRVPFNIRGDKVNYGDPVEVKIVYEDKPQTKQDKQRAAASFVAGMATAASHSKREVTVFASRAESGRNQATQEGGSALDYPALAKRLGLPEDTPPEQIDAKLDEFRAAEETRQTAEEQSGQAGTGKPDGGSEGHDGPSPEVHREGPHQNIGGPATKPPEEAKEPEVEGGLVKIDLATYRSLKEGAEAGTTLLAERRKEKAEQIVAQAVKDGKIAPARKEHFLRAMAADPEGTTTLLTAKPEEGGLAPGLVPVGEVGSGGGNGDQVAEGEGLPDGWFPGIEQKRVAASRGWRSVSRDVANAREAM